MPNDGHIRIHVPIDAIPHTRLLAPAIQLARRDLARDAFPETHVGEGVDGLLDLGFLAWTIPNEELARWGCVKDGRWRVDGRMYLLV